MNVKDGVVLGIAGTKWDNITHTQLPVTLIQMDWIIERGLSKSIIVFEDKLLYLVSNIN